MLLQIFLFSFLGFSSSEQSFLPRGQCDQTIHHKHYSLCYSQDHRQALWTTHKLTQKSIRGKQRRTDDYREDYKIFDPVNERDFKDSGYDRGHLVPAADMKLTYRAMSQTFYMSNMSPQRPSFNQGIWAYLEKKIRRWVKRDGHAYVVTAPILENGLLQLNAEVSIPKYYYKIAYFPGRKIIKAFLIPNRDIQGKNIYRFSISVDEIEELTGLNFFSELPDKLEDELELINYYQ